MRKLETTLKPWRGYGGAPVLARCSDGVVSVMLRRNFDGSSMDLRWFFDGSSMVLRRI
jgi:hypothetical protein